MNGIIRLHIENANFDKMGGLLHRMHCGVHITVGDNPMWRSGVSDDSGHKCHWKNKHVDIDSKFVGQMMKIQGMDYDKKKG